MCTTLADKLKIIIHNNILILSDIACLVTRQEFQIINRQDPQSHKRFIRNKRRKLENNKIDPK